VTAASESDLLHVFSKTEHVFNELRGQRVFVTGGTGFFGSWLLETFAFANDRLQLGAEMVVLTRNPDAFREKAPHLAQHPAITLHRGDVCDFEYPAGPFSYFIHASAESNVQLVTEQPLLLFTTHIDGARRVFEFAKQCSVKGVLFTSSGCVYGRQPPELSHVSEDYPGSPAAISSSPVAAANAGGIRGAELLGSLYAKQHGLPVKFARCFTLIGPYLPLSKPFASTSLMRNALGGEPISIGGDGTAVRSYLYAADLAIWLWTILFNGKPGEAYNVGSEEAVTITELAKVIAGIVSPSAEIRVATAPVPGRAAERYVPSTEKARRELGLQQWIALPDAVQRTAAWHREQSGRDVL
jgi:dTDP-glucose 4,6-dehydratase